MAALILKQAWPCVLAHLLCLKVQLTGDGLTIQGAWPGAVRCQPSIQLGPFVPRHQLLSIPSPHRSDAWAQLQWIAVCVESRPVGAADALSGNFGFDGANLVLTTCSTSCSLRSGTLYKVSHEPLECQTLLKHAAQSLESHEAM